MCRIGILSKVIANVLTQLRVLNHTLVDTLDIEFQEGLSAITGETGAGKSILLNALGLTLGDRAGSDQIRAGSERAEISATFDIGNLPTATDFLAERGLDQGGECILRRVVNRNGSSKAWVNDRPVTLNILRALAEQLVSIHSQHEHQSLLKPDYQLQLLDGYAQAADLAETTAASFQEWRELAAELHTQEEMLGQHRQRKEFLEFQLEELLLLDLSEGEFALLENEQKQLATAEQIRQRLYEAMQLVSENEEFQILGGMRQLSNLIEPLDVGIEAVEDARSMTADVLIQMEEVRDALRRAADQIRLDPQRLDEVNIRLSSAFDLARKHRCEPDELSALSESMRAELDQLGDLDANLESLLQQSTERERHYRDRATQLGELRRSGAAQLEQEVSRHFAELNMEGADLLIELHDSAPAASGLERVEFLIRTNPGQPHLPLARVASGGELSRISLAIQVVTAADNQHPTLVFDEVDQGIGGATASVVGKKLRMLGERAQVICVTHLAQVASEANQHLMVEKSSGNDTTTTRISRLDPTGRQRETARMLGGDNQSEHSLRHAEELLEHSSSRQIP